LVYVQHSYDVFECYTGCGIRATRTKDERVSAVFETYTLPSLQLYYDLFYTGQVPLGKTNPAKRVPPNIADYLTLMTLVYWVSDDGAYYIHDHDFCLYTDCFPKEDQLILIDALVRNFELTATIYTRKSGSNYLHFSVAETNALKAIVLSIMQDLGIAFKFER
jgi:hypothetical protein